jgi:DNA modification methylase
MITLNRTIPHDTIIRENRRYSLRRLLAKLKDIDSESIDLIYIDPPSIPAAAT